MLGFFFGILFLAAIFGAFRFGARRRWRHGRYGGRGRWGRTWMVDRVLRRLDATPEQEAEVRATIRELLDELRRHRSTFEALREEVAGAVTEDSPEGGRLDEAFARVEGAAGEARDAVRRAFTRLHTVLDARQREVLAEILRGGFGATGCAPRQAHPVRL